MTDPTDIFQWQRRDDRLTTSGQPTEAQLAALAAIGVTTVVNLALHDHPKALADEAASVAALGMRYVHIPVDFDRPTSADFDRFQGAMDSASEERVHVHCIANLRVTAFFYRRDVGSGVPEPEARARMEEMWRPGGVWADFTGRPQDAGQPHRYAGRDY